MNLVLDAIQKKLNSLSFIPGFTLPSDEALFYVVITELRIHYQFPLIIIEKSRDPNYKSLIEEYHTNGTLSEYILAKYLVLSKIKATKEHNFKLSFRRELNKMVISLPTVRFPSRNLLRLFKAINSKNRNEIQRCFNLEIASIVEQLNIEGDSAYLEDSIIENLLKHQTMKTFFSEKGILTPFLKAAFGSKNASNALKIFWHYNPNMRKYTFMNFLVNLRIFVADVMSDYENEFLDKITRVSIVQNGKWRIIIFCDREDLLDIDYICTNGIFSLIEKYTSDKKNTQLEYLFVKDLSQVVKYRNFVLKETAYSANKSSILAKIFQDSIYFKVFDNVASKIHRKFLDLTEIKEKNYKFDFTFFLLDKSYWFTWYIPSDKILARNMLLLSDGDKRYFGLRRKFSWYKIEDEEGFSEYVANTGYPQWFSNFLLQRDYGHRLMRFRQGTWSELLQFFGLVNNSNENSKMHCIQIPIVFSLIHFDDPRTQHLTEKYGLCGIFPIYNFNFNIKADQNNPYHFFRLAFDFSFECMFVMSYLQKNQEDFLKSQLFEDATDSYKMAMEFEFPEKVSLENEKAFRKRNSENPGTI